MRAAKRRPTEIASLGYKRKESREKSSCDIFHPFHIHPNLSFKSPSHTSLPFTKSDHRPPTTTLAPSFPNTPASIGFGLLCRPFFLLRKPNIPFGLLCPTSDEPPLLLFLSSPSTSLFCIFAQLPCSSSTTCTPPPLLAVRVPVRPCWCCCWRELLRGEVAGWDVGNCCCCCCGEGF